mgnify:CR=1 FL=1
MRLVLLMMVLTFCSGCEMIEQYIAQQQGIDLEANPEAQVNYFAYFKELAQKLPAEKAKEKIMEKAYDELIKQGKSDTEAKEEVAKVEEKIDSFIKSMKEGDTTSALVKLVVLLVALFGAYGGTKVFRKIKK